MLALCVFVLAAAVDISPPPGFNRVYTHTFDPVPSLDVFHPILAKVIQISLTLILNESLDAYFVSEWKEFSEGAEAITIHTSQASSELCRYSWDPSSEFLHIHNVTFKGNLALLGTFLFGDAEPQIDLVYVSLKFAVSSAQLHFMEVSEYPAANVRSWTLKYNPPFFASIKGPLCTAGVSETHLVSAEVPLPSYNRKSNFGIEGDQIFSDFTPSITLKSMTFGSFDDERSGFSTDVEFFFSQGPPGAWPDSIPSTVPLEPARLRFLTFVSVKEIHGLLDAILVKRVDPYATIYGVLAATSEVSQELHVLALTKDEESGKEETQVLFSFALPLSGFNCGSAFVEEVGSTLRILEQAGFERRLFSLVEHLIPDIRPQPAASHAVLDRSLRGRSDHRRSKVYALAVLGIFIWMGTLLSGPVKRRLLQLSLYERKSLIFRRRSIQLACYTSTFNSPSVSSTRLKNL